MYLDAMLLLSLIASNFALLILPLGLTIVSGSALFANRMILRSKTQKQFRFKQTIVIGAKKNSKKALVEKKILKPLQTSKPRVEFGFHTCPVHGLEKCAGNYLDLHSCNSSSQTSAKQIFWKEITPALPSK